MSNAKEILNAVQSGDDTKAKEMFDSHIATTSSNLLATEQQKINKNLLSTDNHNEE